MRVVRAGRMLIDKQMTLSWGCPGSFAQVKLA